MNDELLNSKCEACNINAHSLSEEEIKNLHPKIPSWSVIEDEDKLSLIHI